jgi:hypothetical protein
VLRPDSLPDWISFSKTTTILSTCCSHIFSEPRLFLQNNIYLFNVCYFCQGILLGLCTASPSLDPHFYLFYSPMDSPSVPHFRRGHISFEGGESHTNRCCSICLLLVFWFVEWMVVRYVGCVNYSTLFFFEYPEGGGRRLLGNWGDSLSLSTSHIPKQ